MTTQLHTGILCPVCGNETNVHKIGCPYANEFMLDVKPILAPVTSPTSGRAFEPHVERAYADAFKSFGHLVASPDHRPVWLRFQADASCPGNTASYRRDRSNLAAIAIDLPIPTEFAEADIHDLVKKYLADGFIFKGAITA